MKQIFAWVSKMFFSQKKHLSISRSVNFRSIPGVTTAGASAWHEYSDFILHNTACRRHYSQTLLSLKGIPFLSFSSWSSAWQKCFFLLFLDIHFTLSSSILFLSCSPFNLHSGLPTSDFVIHPKSAYRATCNTTWEGSSWLCPNPPGPLLTAPPRSWLLCLPLALSLEHSLPWPGLASRISPRSCPLAGSRSDPWGNLSCLLQS